MTIRDANAVNAVIDALLAARDAAHKALGAGVRGDTIRRHWPQPDGWRRARR